MTQIVDLQKGHSFQLRKNGKWYTVHAKVREVFNNGVTSRGTGDLYVIAVNGKTMFAFPPNLHIYARG